MKRLVNFLGLILLVSACQNETAPPNQQETISNTKVQPFALPHLPKSMQFAGQTISLEDDDIMERLDRELLVNAYYQSATTQIFKRANRWFPMIERILREEGIPDDFKYLAVIESSLMQATSPAGAEGFWQFMPKTAIEYGLEITPEIDERLHIEKSTRAACAYLKQANDTLKDWLAAAASYNRGMGGVRSDMRWQGTDHYFDTDQNSETGRYVFRILAMKLIFERPEEYGFAVTKMQLYEPFQTRTVEVSETIPNLALWAKEQGINFKILTKLNPWLKTNRLTIRSKPYRLLLPTENENLKPYRFYSVGK